jgi:hypothetical protein
LPHHAAADGRTAGPKRLLVNPEYPEYVVATRSAWRDS